jgi:2'-5' RNA ligase
MRLFVAASFPQEVLRDLNGRVAALRPRLPSASWTREETQHLTFAFLGEQPESLVETLAKPMCAALSALPRFEARLRASGFFPNPRRARVGWIGLEPESQFVAVAEAVRRTVTAAGITLDGGEFKPHLTVFRIRDPWPPASIDLFTKSFRDYVSSPFAVDRVTLYSSRLDPRGAVHTPLRTFPLAP